MTQEGSPRQRLLQLLVVLAGLGFLLLASVPARAAEGLRSESYRLDAGDKVRVTVYGHEDLSGEFEVDGTGGLSLPLVRTVQAAGLTAGELEAAIVGKLKPDYLRDPRVSVEILIYRPIYVIGEVQAPGSYPYASGMTAINAVAMAGGYTYRARKSKVMIIRGAKEQQEKIKAEPDTPLLPGDVIEVSERFF
jgi:polysaccharide export outer membrane protein